MDSLVSLKYPNGRTHHASLTTADDLAPGAEFDLHGRHWRAVGFVSSPGRAGGGAPRLLCVTADDASPLQVMQAARQG